MASARLQGKVAVITGAASGLGREIAINYAANGTKLILIADLQDKPSVGTDGDEEYTVAKLNRLHGEGTAAFFRTDVTNADSVKATVQEAIRLGGRLDIWVNNAGIAGSPTPTLFHDGDDAQFDLIMSVNLRGVYLGCKHAIAQMLAQEPDASGKRGRVLNIVSILGLRAIGGFTTTAGYCASKGAAMNLTRMLALEYRDKGINVNALCPGFLKTAMTGPIHEDPATNVYLETRGGWGTIKDVAPSAVYLVSDDANWVYGVGMVVDGGLTAG